MASDVDGKRFDILWARAQKELPGIKIVLHKDSKFLGLTRWALKHLLRQKKNYSRSTTTVGRTMYVPDSFWEWPPKARYVLLRHELVHLRQFRCWPLPFLKKTPFWVFNAFLFGLAYLMLLPIKFTMRARFEKEAYTQTMLAWYELGVFDPSNQLQVATWVADMERVFSTGSYFYMARKGSSEGFVRSTARGILSGAITGRPEDII